MDERCIIGLEAVGANLSGCALAIGNFDGVHLGHQNILRLMRDLAAAEAAPAVAVTFEPPPEVVLGFVPSPQFVTPTEQKCRLLLETGADYVVIARTDAGLLRLTAEEFIEKIIVGTLGARHVVEGEDFSFGRGRHGNVRTLFEAGARHGFNAHVVQPVMIQLPEGSTRVSSTLVRQLVLLGRMEEAHRCLGRPFTLYETIVRGAGQGRLLEFPTANIAPSRQICPGDGVYAGTAGIDGRRFAAAISVGSKPTLGTAKERVVEAFLLDAEGDFYGRTMALSFLQRIRGQEKFANVEALKAQIARDVQRVRELTRECG